MASLTLYGNRNSGHSYKVRLALVLADLTHDYIHVDLSLPRAQRPEAFRAVSRFGEVPVLVVNGEPLCQSNAILQWLADSYGHLDGTGGERQHIREWLSWEINRIGFSVPNLRFYRRFAPAEPAVLAWLTERARADLDTLQDTLTGCNWLAGSRATIADVSVSAYLWWLAEAGLDIRHWPAVEAWLARLAALPGWEHPDTLMASEIPD